MSKKVFLWFYFLILTSASTFNAKNDQSTSTTPAILKYLDVKSIFNLDSDEAITQYLPQRLKELVRYAKDNGIEATITMIDDDPDLDSYLFILEAEKPQKLLAYSRNKQLCNKTPQELQQIIFPNEPSYRIKRRGTQQEEPLSARYNIERTVTQIIETAYKGTTYIRYLWRLTVDNQPQNQIAYVTLYTEKQKKFVLGAAIFNNQLFDYIILPHRANTIIKRIKQEGTDRIFNLINNDKDPELYFYVNEFNYPNRCAAHGGGYHWLIHKTPEDEDFMFPHKDIKLTARNLINNLVDTAKKGSGFYAYLYPDLKIAYTQKFTVNKRSYIITTGYKPAATLEQITNLQKFVEYGLELINSIGLDNAISTLKKENTPDRYIFIDELIPPYRYVLNINPNLNQHTAIEIQSYLDSFGKSPINIVELAKQFGSFAKKGGGFYTYIFLLDIQNPQKGLTLKVSFILPFTSNNIPYCIGTGIPIEKAYQDLITNARQKVPATVQKRGNFTP